MPIAIHSFQIESDGKIQIEHTFFGHTAAEAKRIQKEHAGGCPHYGPAFRQGDTIDIEEEIDTMPVADEEELLEFLELGEEEEEEEAER